MKTYTVQTGETLTDIAIRFLGDRSYEYLLIAENHLSDVVHLPVGQTIRIPETPEEIHTLDDGYVKNHSISLEQMAKIFRISDKVLLNKYYDILNVTMLENELTTRLRQAHFLTQISYDSRGLRYLEDDFNYGTFTLLHQYGEFFDQRQAVLYERKPQQIASRIYANRLGNNSESSLDGWNYRARGLIKLLGRDTYAACGDDLGIDLLNHPDLVSKDPHIAVLSSIWVWQSQSINSFADQDNIQQINQLLNHFRDSDERAKFLYHIKKALDLEAKK